MSGDDGLASDDRGQPAGNAATEAILRRLFWQLLVRGRVPTTGGKKQFSFGMKGTVALYVLLGLFPAVGVAVLPPLAFATSLHGLTLLFASLSLATAMGQMLFVRDEAEILLHRPVLPQQLLRAKVAVLVAYALIQATALNLIGWVAATFVEGYGWRWFLAHAGSTVLLMVGSAATTVVGYQLCLRWCGRERLDNLLATMQAVLSVSMVLGVHLGGRLVRSDMLESLAVIDGWMVWLPPVWFGALDAFLCGTLPFAEAALPVGIGVGLTVLSCWLAFVVLARSFDRGLMTLHEGGAHAGEAGGRRWLGDLSQAIPLRWWLPHPVERHAFTLVTAYLWRDREVKLKLLPSLAPVVVLPLLMATDRDRFASSIWIGLGLIYQPMVILQAMEMLQRSEQFRATELVRATPLPHWLPLYDGARKAVLLWMVLPSFALVLVLLHLFAGELSIWHLGVVVAASFPVYTLVPGCFGPWLPLSLPSQGPADLGKGCLTVMLAVCSSLTLIGTLLLADSVGWYWPVAGVWLCLLVVSYRGLRRHLRRMPWALRE